MNKVSFGLAALWFVAGVYVLLIKRSSSILDFWCVWVVCVASLIECGFLLTWEDKDKHDPVS